MVREGLIEKTIKQRPQGKGGSMPRCVWERACQENREVQNPHRKSVSIVFKEWREVWWGRHRERQGERNRTGVTEVTKEAVGEGSRWYGALQASISFLGFFSLSEEKSLEVKWLDVWFHSHCWFKNKLREKGDKKGDGYRDY